MVITAFQIIFASFALVISSSILSVGSVAMVNATTARLFEKVPSTTGGTSRYLYVSNEAQRLRDKIENYPRKLRHLYVMSSQVMFATLIAYLAFTPDMHKDFVHGFVACLFGRLGVEDFLSLSENVSDYLGGAVFVAVALFGVLLAGYAVLQITKIFQSYICVLRDF